MNEIPPITHPLGRYWHQPSPADILLDDTHALMDPKAFDALEEYSCSSPSGVYEGKMWKRYDGIHDVQFLRAGGQPEWLLCWFGPAANPDQVSINTRVILIS